MRVVMIYKYGKRFRYAPSFNKINFHVIFFTGVTAVDDKERVEEGLKLDLLRCFRGTGFLREPADFSFVFETNWSDKYCQ